MRPIALECNLFKRLRMKRAFQFSSGSLALDFADTVAGRATVPTELLAGPADLDRWFAEAGLSFSGPVSGADVATARAIRDAIYQAVGCVIDGGEPDEETIAILNTAAAKPDLRPQWTPQGVVYVAAVGVEAAFARIAADAIEVLRVEGRARLRRCPECGMLFHDRSRPGKRRWCSSASGCGNRAKVRRHRANKRKERSSA